VTVVKVGRLQLVNTSSGAVIDNYLVAPVMRVRVVDARPVGTLTPDGE